MFDGVIAPAVTLLQRDGSIDAEQNRRHIDFLISSEVSGVYVFGTSGEFMHFNLRERESHAAQVVEHVAGRKPVIVGAASTATDDAVRLSRHAQGIGAAAVAVATPYFWTLSEREVMGHFSSVASAVDIPILVYNVPSFSGFDISSPTLIALMKENPNIAGVIDAVDSADHARSRILALRDVNPEFQVLSASDAQVMNLLELGGNGVLPATANIVPELYVRIVRAYENDDFRGAIEAYRKLARVLSMYQVEGSFHSVVKEAMVLLGLASSSTVRSPALPLTTESRTHLRTILRRSGLLNDEDED